MCAATMDTPFFSVVIPTHQRDDLLRQAIDSVRSQGDQDFEVLVVDDADRASTRLLVERYDDPRIRYLRNDHHRGGAGTRNAGVGRARGRWVAFLDDDDTWQHTKLEKVRSLIGRSGDELGMVYSGHVKFDFDRSTALAEVKPSVRGHVLRDVLYRNCIGGLSSVIVKRSVLTEIGGLDERFPSLQDMELYVRVAQRSTVDFVPEPLVFVRKGPEPRISFNRGKKLEGAMLFAEKYADLVRGDRRLRHRTAARTFVFALSANDGREVRRNAVWAVAGLVFDPKDAGFVLGALLRHVVARVRGAADQPRPETT